MMEKQRVWNGLVKYTGQINQMKVLDHSRKDATTKKVDGEAETKETKFLRCTYIVPN